MNTLREALLRGRRRPRNTGAGSPTLYRGDGYEFVELREYIAGDDVRRIDWAATARSGELQTRVVLEDVALTLAAIVDESDSMLAGRNRPIADAAREALESWYGAASPDDRCMRVSSSDMVVSAGMRGARSAQLCLAAAQERNFSLTRAFEIAYAALPRGTALLVISDFYDLPADDELLIALGRRFDCTALVARDPWYDELPLGGFVRVRDAESDASARLYIGKRERESYRTAVRERENRLLHRLTNANWRCDVLDEDNGGAALLRAFAVR